MTDTALQRKNMVESQVRPSDVTDRRITAAMRALPREQFVPRALADLAYIDTELAIAPGRSLTPPRDLARIIQLCDFDAADRVLIIAAGTGYTAAVVAALAGKIVALESDAALSQAAAVTLSGLAINNVTSVVGALEQGVAEYAPYNVILIDGMISVIPDALVAQLADNGRIVAIMAEGGIARATRLSKAGVSLARWPAFEATAARLGGGFADIATFEF